MRKLSILLLFVMVASTVLAQSQQELLEAYRNGTLTQAQISKAQQNNANVRRTRQATTAATTAAQSQQTEPASQVDWQNGYYINGRYVPGIQYTLGTDGTFRFNTNDPRYKILTRESRDFDPRRGRQMFVADSLKRDSMLRLMPELRDMLEENPKVVRIFGHDMFNNSQMTFEPNLNIATPDNYVLGAGDELIVDVWGNSQMTHQTVVTPDGRVVIPDMGPVAVAGLTISEAKTRVRNALGAIYEGLYDGSVKMSLTLSGIRSIQVNVMGEVGVAGTYTLPSLATLFHALYVAGGVNEIGTLRNIKLYRGGKLFSEVDVYDYILNGKSEGDIALRDGDLVSIPAYGKLVEISGEIKRPMFYEMKQIETVADLIHFHIHIITAAGLKTIGQKIIFPELFVCSPFHHFAFQQFHLLTGTDQIRKCRTQNIFHGESFREFGNLRDQTQFFIGINKNFSVIIVHLTGKDVEQRGLAHVRITCKGYRLHVLLPPP